jgi:uncharacterized membrane protein
MMRNQKSSRFHKLNKKLVGIGVGIVIVIIILIIILIGMQSYKAIPENVSNQSNVQQLPNVTLQKPVNVGKHITVELNESMHFTIK